LAIFPQQGKAIEPWQPNPWYWAHDGDPVLLLGGSDDDNLFQWPRPRLLQHLDRIAGAGGNVVRNTMSDRQDGGFEVYPFREIEPGKYDLRQWNPEYWGRFQTFLEETARREIFVQIEVWDRFDYTDARADDPDRWETHPYNPAHNVNYSFADSGFARRYPAHPGKNRQPFFFTTPPQRNNQTVLPFQERFVDKLLDHVLPFDHVLYCIDNETSAEPEWGAYWASFIRGRAQAAGRQVMITEMWDDWNLKAARHRQTFDHPERYDFVDVSQNNHNRGQEHWDNFLYVRRYLQDQPRPMNTTKIYGADGNKFGHSDQDAIERFWRHLLGGGASLRFHRPDSGLGINDKAVVCIRAARHVEQHIPFWSIDPANDLLGARQPDEAYLAASSPRDRLVVFFPAQAEAAEVLLTVPVPQAGWQIRWVDIDQGTVSQSTPWHTTQLTPPGPGNYAAILLAP